MVQITVDREVPDLGCSENSANDWEWHRRVACRVEGRTLVILYLDGPKEWHLFEHALEEFAHPCVSTLDSRCGSMLPPILVFEIVTFTREVPSQIQDPDFL